MSKKRRGKKYNPRKAATKYLSDKVTRMARKVYCYDGKCFPQMQFNGINKGHPLARDALYSVADDPHPWRIMLMAFELVQGEKRMTPWIIDDIPPTSSNKLNTLLDNRLIELIKTRNKNHLVSWGWFAVPMEDVDLDAMIPEMYDLFEDAGAFDLEHCNKMHDKRVENEKLEEVMV